ncbi:MAG: proton-conducting transporter membrane subunit [Elusimicrobiota bacterium]
MLALFVLIPLTAAAVISAINRFPRRILDAVSVISTVCVAVISFRILNTVIHNGIAVYKIGGWLPPAGITLVADGLTAMMLVLVNVVISLLMIYSVEYAEHYSNKWKYYALFQLLLAGLNGVLISGDLFNMFIFLEIASIASYALVSYECDGESFEASIKYAVPGTLSSILILLAIALIYAKTSTLNLADIAMSWNNDRNIFNILIVALLTAGFAFKTALVPFHSWLPDAHPSAPSPISAVLSGVVIKTIGVYAMMRLFFNVIGFSHAFSSILLILGTISMLSGVLLALSQWDFKRLLAYHSISQVGYIILGLGLGTPLGILGGLFHLFNHSLFKPLLFLVAGSVQRATGTRNLKELGGLNKKMPLTGFSSLVASLSISGIPPLNGFWSKLIIILACIQAGKYWFASFAVFASILTLASFLKIQRYVFFGFQKDRFLNVKESGWKMTVPMIVISVLCVCAGMLLLSGIYENFLGLAQNALLSGTGYAKLVALELMK